jgi:bla regulator protein BlaR1
MTPESWPATAVTVGHVLGDHLWQSTGFFGVIAVLALALKPNGPRVRCWLWLAASLKFLVPFGALIALGTHLSWRSAAPSPPAQVMVLMDALTQPLSGSVPLAATTPALAPNPLARAVPSGLIGLWCLGSAFMLGRWFIGSRRVMRVVRNSTVVESGKEFELLRNLEHRAGMTRSLPLLRCDDSIEPGVFGIVRPTLLWPRTLSARLTDAQVEAILAHELAHVRRHDNLTAATHMIVEALFWFYPLVWWIGARLVDERERACDQDVLELGSDPESYAESIVKTCEFYAESPLTCVSGVTGSDLKRRIERIMRGDATLRLSVAKKVVLGLTALMLLAAPVSIGAMRSRQSAPTNPVVTPNQRAPQPMFAVASVKPNASGDVRVVAPPPQPGGRYTATNIPLDLLIAVAYQPLQRYEIAGVPDWAKTTRFDIEAKADGNPPAAQIWLMLQSLLAGRFKLAAHKETRQQSIYALTAVNGQRLGAQLRRHTDNSGCVEPVPGRATPAPDPTRPLPKPPCGAFSGAPALGRLAAQDVTLDTVGRALSGQVGRMVLDRTGLSGTFDLTLEWTPERRSPGIDASAGDPPLSAGSASIFTAVEEQLGLKLVPTTGPVDVLVIDHVEHPTDDNADPSKPSPTAPTQGQAGQTRWIQDSSDHFECFYQAAARSQIDEVLRETERAYNSVSTGLRHDLPFRPALIVFGNRANAQRASALDQLVASVGSLPASEQRVLVSADMTVDQRTAELTRQIREMFNRDIGAPTDTPRPAR